MADNTDNQDVGADGASTQANTAVLLAAQKRRNMWLAAALVGFVVIVGVTTAVRIQETDFSGGDRLYFSGYLDEAAKEKADRERQAAQATPIMVTAPGDTEADADSTSGAEDDE